MNFKANCITRGSGSSQLRALGTANLKRFLEGSFRAFWLLVSWHWVAIGVIVLVVSYVVTKLRKFVVLMCGLLILVDAIGTIIAVEFFFGNEMLSLAGLALLSAVAFFEGGSSPQA